MAKSRRVRTPHSIRYYYYYYYIAKNTFFTRLYFTADSSCYRLVETDVSRAYVIIRVSEGLQPETVFCVSRDPEKRGSNVRERARAHEFNDGNIVLAKLLVYVDRYTGRHSAAMTSPTFYKRTIDVEQSCFSVKNELYTGLLLGYTRVLGSAFTQFIITCRIVFVDQQLSIVFYL